MAVIFAKPGQSATVPGGMCAVIVTVPVSVVAGQDGATAMKLAAIASCRDQINRASEALQKTDAELDAAIVAHQAAVDVLKTSRGSGALE